MKTQLTPRSFRIAYFKDTHGEHCSLQESSSVVPCVWFGYSPHRMHLSQKHVQKLLPYLTYFAKHGTLPDHNAKKRSSK